MPPAHKTTNDATTWDDIGTQALNPPEAANNARLAPDTAAISGIGAGTYAIKPYPPCKGGAGIINGKAFVSGDICILNAAIARARDTVGRFLRSSIRGRIKDFRMRESCSRVGLTHGLIWPTPLYRLPGFPVDNACGHRRRRHWMSFHFKHDCPLSATKRFPSPRHEHGTVCQPKWRHQIRPPTNLQNQTKIFIYCWRRFHSFQIVIASVKCLKCYGTFHFKI